NFVNSGQVQMTINTSTAADNWTVKVTNPDNQASNVFGFSVVAPVAAPPHINSEIGRASCRAGNLQTITINGTGFANPPTVFVTWMCIEFTRVPVRANFVNSGQVQMTINTSTTADNWTVKVTNPDNQVSNVFGFSVVAPVAAPPHINS